MHKGYKYYIIFGAILVVIIGLVVGIVIATSHGGDNDKTTPQTYTVKFLDYDDTQIGVTINGTVVYEQIVEHGNSAIAPQNPTRDGYIFDHWDKGFTNVTENLLVKAVYRTQTFTVKFYDYDNTPLGVLIDDNIVYEQQVEISHSAVAPTNPNRVGYRFSSWSKDYSNILADLDVYAQYVQVCEVLFLDYDFSVYETQIVDYGKNARLPDVDPTREGYRFDYWEGRLINIISNTELNAIYVKQWTVTFVDYDDTELKVQSVDEGGTATAPQNPTRQDEYVFDHWDKEFSNVTENIVVKAVYKVATYNVSFVDFDGTTLKEQVVYKGEDATAPDLSEKIYVDFVSVQKQGYKFVGWDKEFTNILSDLTVTALYETVTTPILYIETEVVESGNNQTVGVSVYIISPTSFGALNIDVEYDENLSLTQNDVIVKNIFGTQNRYTVNVDTVEHELEFSWVYSTNEYTLPNNYAEVFEMRFQIDKYIAQGDYLVQFLSTCVYVKDFENNVPIVISGAVKVV